MKKITRKIALDFSRRTNTRVTFATEADFGSREFLISFYDDGTPYPVSKSLTAVVNVHRTDGASTAYAGEITSGGQVRFIATNWSLAVPGETRISVSIYDGNDEKLTSDHFSIVVKKALYLGEGITEDDESYNVFTQMMNGMALANERENARVVAETNRIFAETAREDAEEKRKYAEGEVSSGSTYYGGRALAEFLRQANETARVESESARERAETARSEREKARVTSETDRIFAETARADREEERKYAEGELGSGSTYYGGRALAEYLREINEGQRVSAENQRIANENERAEVSEAMKTALANLIAIQEKYITGEETA